MKVSLAKELIDKGFVKQDLSSIEWPATIKAFQFIKAINDKTWLFFSATSSDYCEEIQEFHLYNHETKTKLYLNTNDVNFAIKCAEIIEIDPDDCYTEREVK